MMLTALACFLFLMGHRFALGAECNYYASKVGPIVADYCGAVEYNFRYADSPSYREYSCAGTYDQRITELYCTSSSGFPTGYNPRGVCYLDDNCAQYYVKFDHYSQETCGEGPDYYDMSYTYWYNYEYEYGRHGTYQYRSIRIITSGGANRCSPMRSGSVRYSDIDRNGYNVTIYSQRDCKGTETVQSIFDGDCIPDPDNGGDSVLVTIRPHRSAPGGATVCESEGRECNDAIEGVGCTSCKPFYDRVLVDGYFECIRNDIDDLSQDEIDYACGGGCTSDNCLQEDNPNCEIEKDWGCKKCKKGYFRRDNDHLCVSCSLIPHCQTCGNDEKEWDGCDYCEKGYKLAWDFLLGYNRCIEE